MGEKPVEATISAPVIIVGAGLGGLMLAAICRKIKLHCIVLERAASMNPAGAGISLAPNAMRALEQLGIYDYIKRHGQPLRKMLVHHNETVWREMDFTGVEDEFDYPVYSIERAKLHQALVEAAGGVSAIHWGLQVVDVVDDPSRDCVVVETSCGKKFSGDVVIGADGIRSTVRRVLAQDAGLDSINSIQFTGRVHMSGYTAPLPNLGKESEGVGNWLFYDDAILTSWPCKDNRQWYIGVKAVPLGQKEPSKSVWQGATMSTVNEVYGDKFHPFGINKKVRDVVDQSERVIASNVFAEKDFPSMSRGRVALLGDAAHSMTSFFGQGACQAIEDATELANALIEHYFNPDHISLTSNLERYSAARGQRGREIASFSAKYAAMHVARLPYGLGPLVRKIVYAYLPMWYWFKGLEWLYGYQPTVQHINIDLSTVT
ncbi:hypothetical protein LTS08_004572 [Lithohypha guttulata]|nr:hypothetical protein LTS08_004572 [Lithohypha guttulata]